VKNSDLVNIANPWRRWKNMGTRIYNWGSNITG